MFVVRSAHIQANEGWGSSEIHKLHKLQNIIKMSSNIKQQVKKVNFPTMQNLSASLIVILFALSFHSFGSAMTMQLVEQMDPAGASPTGRSSGSSAATLAIIESPELTAGVLENLLRSILFSVNNGDLSNMQSAQKRGLDLGISRGFSGSQAGKHLMGLSAASFANGPGR